MFARHDPAWREVLTHAGLTATELTAATEDHHATGRSLAASALALGFVAREPLLAAMVAAGSRPEADDASAWSSQAPVVRYVDNVLAQAVHDRASDLHFEPFEHDFKVRGRVDGTLRELAPPAKELAGAVISRLKVLAGLNIAERRVPQDGRIRATLAGRAVDLRVSTLPTQFGESVVLRVLDREAAGLDLDRLGMPAVIRSGFDAAIGQPHGMVLVTGPTGSGKTTTLYGALQAIHAPGVKILTAEDPVEYEIDGVMQLPIQPAIGLTFAHALRAFLRQDPDVILVGEIRDAETAQVAMQAALTGHLVLSTLHTNDAVSTVTRLRDMGIEPYLLASTLTGVLAQRLVRRLCSHCREAYVPTVAEQRDAGFADSELDGRLFYRPRGCPQCGHSGYQGRTGVFEWLRCTESVRALIVQEAPAWQLQEHAVAQGLRTLREHAREKLLAGETSLAEVLRHT